MKKPVLDGENLEKQCKNGKKLPRSSHGEATIGSGGRALGFASLFER